MCANAGVMRVNVTKFLNEPSQETESSIEGAPQFKNSHMSSRFLPTRHFQEHHEAHSRRRHELPHVQKRSRQYIKAAENATKGALGVREGNTRMTEAAYELTE